LFQYGGKGSADKAATTPLVKHAPDVAEGKGKKKGKKDDKKDKLDDLKQELEMVNPFFNPLTTSNFAA